MSFRESKNFKTYAIIGIVALAAVLWLLWPKREPKSDLIDYLQRQNDSLRIENRIATEREVIRQARVDSLFNAMKGVDREIIRTKEFHEKIIRMYDTADAAAIERFFTDRYK